MPTFLVSLAVWCTIVAVATIGILSSDLVGSLQHLGCILNSTCTTNS